MTRAHARFGIAVASFALAAAALAIPLWAEPLLDTSSPEAAHASAERAVLLTRGSAGALAVGGMGVLLALARRERSGVARPLAVLAGVCAAAAIVAHSPWAEGQLTGAVEAAYVDGAFLARSESVDSAWPSRPDDAMPVFTGTRTFPDATAPLEAGPLRARAGDTWSVWVSVKGRGWEGDAQPTLSVDPPARCAVAQVDDFRNDQGPGIGVRWRCVVLTTGEARIQALLPESSDGVGGILVSVVPSLDLAMVASLADSFTALAGTLAASALGARAVARRDAPAGK